MSGLGGRLPEGLEDWGPERRERIEALATELAGLFARWGYRLVEPPPFESYETFAAGSLGFTTARAYRFLDADGRLLALRPDLTTGVGRMVARALSSPDLPSPLPLRLRYEGTVFRREPHGSARPHSFWQAGVELIGEAEPDADAEIICLAAAAARALGLPAVRVLLGHAGLLQGAMAVVAAGNPAREAEFRSALAQRDLVSVAAMMDAELGDVFCGGPYEPVEARQILGVLASHAETAIARGASELLALYTTLETYGRPAAWFEPLLLRDLDYYSGAVFELLSPACAVPVAGGGRYDGLLAKFGPPAPATGFAVNLSMASQASPGQPAPARRRVAIAWSDDNSRHQALRIAESLREQGTIAETLPRPRSLASALASASARLADRLVFVSTAGYREIRVPCAEQGLGEDARPAGGAGIH